MGLVHCQACGAQISEKARTCPSCGHPNPSAPKKSRVAAGFLALFLGGLGIHKFYLGQPVQGLLFLLFCWTFIPGLIAFVQAIIYFCSSDEDFARKFG